MLRYRSWLVLSGVAVAALPVISVAAADPVRVALHQEAAAPQKPSISVHALQPVTNLTLSLQPGPSAPSATKGQADPGGPQNQETAPQHVSQKGLAAGKEVWLRLGSGLPGKTLWTGTLDYLAAGRKWHLDLHFDTVVTPTLKVSYDLGHLNLEQHYVEVQLSQPAGRAELVVIGEDGGELGRAAVAFHGEPSGTWLHIPWQPRGAGPVLKLDLKLYDQAGFPLHIELVPWSVTVPHEEVNFASAKWDIEPVEQGKLDESHQRILDILAKVKGRINPRLFVGGHTDTVGSDADNLVLSRNRARAIAGYFRKKGLTLPILYAGSGERVLRVPTQDNVAELANRRADYVLAVEPPALPTGISWQRLD